MERDEGVDGALALLDLAILLWDEGATADEMAQLEQEAFSLFSAPDIQKPGMSVLLLVQNACLEHRLGRRWRWPGRRSTRAAAIRWSGPGCCGWRPAWR